MPPLATTLPSSSNSVACQNKPSKIVPSKLVELKTTPSLPRKNKSSENVKAKTISKVTRNIGIPNHLFVKTLSILSEIDNLFLDFLLSYQCDI